MTKRPVGRNETTPDKTPRRSIHMMDNLKTGRWNWYFEPIRYKLLWIYGYNKVAAWVMEQIAVSCS